MANDPVRAERISVLFDAIEMSITCATVPPLEWVHELKELLNQTFKDEYVPGTIGHTGYLEIK
jgi:hypothetical protein